MGANECNVAIGNVAVWTKDNDGDQDPSVKRLLGMDLVRYMNNIFIFIYIFKSKYFCFEY